MRRTLPNIGTAILTILAGLSVNAALSFEGGNISAPTPELDQQVEPQTLPAVDGARSGPALPRLRPAIYYEAITDRPLFSPTRRPFTPTAVEQLEAEVEETVPLAMEATASPDLKLMGIMGTSGNPIAFVQNGELNPEWYAIGTTFADWTLTEIGVDWIVISDQEAQIRLDMFQ